MRWDIYNAKNYFPELTGNTWMAQGSEHDKHGKFRVLYARRFPSRAKATAWVDKMRKTAKR